VASGRGRILVRRFAGPAAYVDKMDPLRIVHLTDIHVGRVTPYAVQREAVALTNAQEPDLVVITGDFVCHSQLYLDQLSELMRGIRAPVIGVLGNHDYWAGAEEVRMALERGGVEVLRNQNTTVTVRNQKLQLVGVDDAYTGHARREPSVKGLRTDIPSLALSHIAEEADGLWRHGIPLVLSGHTHGGQVTVARLHEIVAGKIGGHKYIHGLYGNRTPGPDSTNLGAVYVGAGIGAAIIPVRLGERGRREITVFELGCAPGAFEEHHTEQLAFPGRRPTKELVDRRNAEVVRKRERRARKETTEIKLPRRS
jgi:uncharacterized protein